MTNLHITNGDSAANTIKASEIPGDVLPWRDPMHHGPFPAGNDLESLSKLRARYLAGPGLDQSEVERDFRLRDHHLSNAAKYDRVILWFEHDLLDQLQILQLLDWFSRAGIVDPGLEIICIDHYPGVQSFRGIGQLNTKQMAPLIDRRQPVSQAQLTLAKEGWEAFRSDDPHDLEVFLSGALTPLPFLKAAMLRHLQEYPCSQSGLTRTEHQIMTLISGGVMNPGRIFVKNLELENVYFIGDWSTYRHIRDLCDGNDPLVASVSGESFWYPPETQCGDDAFRGQRLQLTGTGTQVLAGDQSAFETISRDHWLGGVHFRTGHPMWTWNTKVNRLEIREP